MQLVVGRIGRAHGIKGEVTVEVRTDEPELRLGPGAVLATDPAARGPLTIADGRVHSGRLLLRFEGVADRTGAEALRNTLLIAEIDPDELPDDPEEFYDHQLVGLDVVTEDGEEVGEISEVLHLPQQDVLSVRPGGRFAGRRGEILIPFVAEIVPDIDLDEQRVTVTPPPGLLDDADAVEAGARGTGSDETDPASPAEDGTAAPEGAAAPDGAAGRGGED